MAIVYNTLQEMLAMTRSKSGGKTLPKSENGKGVKLIDACNAKETIRLAYRVDDKTASRLFTFYPGEVYEIKDELMRSSINGYKVKKPYKAELEERLKNAGIQYEVVRCKSCGGMVRKLEYNVLEVIE